MEDEEEVYEDEEEEIWMRIWRRREMEVEREGGEERWMWMIININPRKVLQLAFLISIYQAIEVLSARESPIKEQEGDILITVHHIDDYQH